MYKLDKLRLYFNFTLNVLTLKNLQFSWRYTNPLRTFAEAYIFIETCSHVVRVCELNLKLIHFQAPWNTVTYEVQNFNLNNQFSSYFDLNSNTGDIRVRLPLYNDVSDTRTYTFTVLARDGGGRTSTQNAQVTINIIRNLFAPQFQNTPYSTIIPFTINSGFSVFDVNATDSDTVVSLSSFNYNFVLKFHCRVPSMF